MNQTSIADTGAARGSLKSYSIGFAFSVILTAIAFGVVVYGGSVSRRLVFTTAVSAGVLQILVHLYFFLHLNTSSSQRWNVLALLFTLMIMVLFVGGSLWIMLNLNYRMM